jgi:hypothetical protein
VNSTGQPKSRRDDFLIAMYNQMHQGISRHTIGVWQSITTLLAAIGALSLAEKHVLSADVAVAFVMLTLVWFLAQVMDASYWYNRNLAMISNIERQFLDDSDLKVIHYYFGQHRKANVFLTNFRIHGLFALTLLVLVLGYHFTNSVLASDPIHVSLSTLLPYAIVIVGAIGLRILWRHRSKSYSEFLNNSPGRTVDTKGVVYSGIGHPVKK